MFNFPLYLQSLANSNKLARVNKFVFGTCSGFSELQGALQQFRKSSAFIIANDISTGATTKISGGWQQERVFSFFIVKQCRFGDEDDRLNSLSLCREIRRQFLSKFLHDYATQSNAEVTSHQLTFDLDDVPSNEYPDLKLNNCTGLNVSIKIAEPVNLCYDEGEWCE